MTDRSAALWMRIARAAFPGVLLLAAAAPLPAQSLTRRLDSRLDAAPFNRHLWGVAVIDQRGKVLYGRNHERLFVPAPTAP